MTNAGDPYLTEHGQSLFERVLTAFNFWLEGIPYVSPGTAGVEAYAQPRLMRDVWPEVENLCIRLEANGNGELSSRIERSLRDVEDYARSIDSYCQSEKFDLDLWLYGDPAQDDIKPVKKSPAALLKQARAVGQPEADEDFYHWSQGREWTRELGDRCEQI